MTSFKECPNCAHVWIDRESFLNDPDIQIVGYQVHFEDLQTGLFLFNHSCGTTMALQVADFDDLYSGPVFQNCKKDSSECSGLCLHKDNLERCPAECECAYVREIIQLFRNR